MVNEFNCGMKEVLEFMFNKMKSVRLCEENTRIKSAVNTALRYLLELAQSSVRLKIFRQNSWLNGNLSR